MQTKMRPRFDRTDAWVCENWMRWKMTRMNSRRDGVPLMFVVVAGNAAVISAFGVDLFSDVMVDFILFLLKCLLSHFP